VSSVFTYTKPQHAATLTVHQYTCTYCALPIYLVNCSFIYSRPYYPNINIFYTFIYLLTHTVIHELCTLLYGIISLGFVTKNVGINMCLILISYGAEGVLSFS